MPSRRMSRAFVRLLWLSASPGRCSRSQACEILLAHITPEQTRETALSHSPARISRQMWGVSSCLACSQTCIVRMCVCVWVCVCVCVCVCVRVRLTHTLSFPFPFLPSLPPSLPPSLTPSLPHSLTPCTPHRTRRHSTARHTTATHPLSPP